jgi:hypothetical protein
MCTHEPVCPDADAQGRLMARVCAARPEQGWSLLCNGVLMFDDGGALLPDGGTVQATADRTSARVHAGHRARA